MSKLILVDQKTINEIAVCQMGNAFANIGRRNFKLNVLGNNDIRYVSPNNTIRKTVTIDGFNTVDPDRIEHTSDFSKFREIAEDINNYIWFINKFNEDTVQDYVERSNARKGVM